MTLNRFDDSYNCEQPIHVQFCAWFSRKQCEVMSEAMQSTNWVACICQPCRFLATYIALAICDHSVHMHSKMYLIGSFYHLPPPPCYAVLRLAHTSKIIKFYKINSYKVSYVHNTHRLIVLLLYTNTKAAASSSDQFDATR